MATPEEILTNLAACLCDQLALSPGGAPATCCVVSSNPVIPDCCSGFAWVRPVGSFPSDNFPIPGYTPSRCIPPRWGLTVELGVSRCAPAICDELGNPCCDNEADAVTISLGDFTAMKLALLCCLPMVTDLGKDQISLGPWVVGDPGGGCVESKMTATIEFLEGCNCG